MAPKAGTTAPATDDVDAMFGDSDGTGGAIVDDGFDDLLDSVEEDDSEGWVPTEKGEGIVGLVVKTGEVRSDFAKPGEDAMCPTVTIQTSDGTKYRVIGYGKVLKDQLIETAPKVGDTLAVKYFGEKPIKKGPYAGKTYKHFQVAIRRAPAAG